MGWIEIILAILAVVSFSTALPQLWGSNWKEIWLYHHKGIISWNTVHKSILEVIDKLQKEDFKPSLIVGVGRGGIICSGLLCSELTGDELVESSKRRKKGIQTPKIKLETINSTIFLKDARSRQIRDKREKLSSMVDKIELSDVNVDIAKNERILVVVAQSFTGSTLEKATDILLSKGALRDNIRTVSVFWHKHKNISIAHEPDIFGRIVSIDKTMPWKYHEITTDRY